MYSMNKDIEVYINAQTDTDKLICEVLGSTINNLLPEEESKVWHGHPVWFLNGNPIVGFSKLKNCIQLLFWSGQSFDEQGLKAEGTFKAADARYTSSDQIDKKDLERWLKKSKEIQWDYKNIRMRRGVLEKLT